MKPLLLIATCCTRLCERKDVTVHLLLTQGTDIFETSRGRHGPNEQAVQTAGGQHAERAEQDAAASGQEGFTRK